MNGRFATLSAIIACFVSSAAWAVTWTGAAGDGKWTTRGNWSSGNLPDAETAVVLPAGSDVTVDAEGCAAWTLTLTNGATLRVVGGGFLKSNKLEINDHCALIVDGGTYQFSGASGNQVFRTGGAFRFLSGNVIWNKYSDSQADLDEPRLTPLMPPKGGTLILPAARSTAMDLNVDGDYSLGGELYVTNSGSVTMRCANNFTGGGKIWLKYFYLTFDSSHKNAVSDFDIRELYLQSGFSLGSYAGTLRFPNGVKLGSFGDWKVLDPNNKRANFKFEVVGPLTFDTKDCFDDGTVHTVSLTNVVGSGISSLRAEGGGTVNLHLNQSPKFPLECLTVGEGTTLSFGNGSATLHAAAFKLEKDSILTLNLGRGQMVSATTADIAATAKIRLTLPETLSPETYYPVYFAPVGSDPDLSLFVLPADIPDGWVLAKSGNAVYLTDGFIRETTKTSGYVWKGSKNGSWSEAENWVGGSVPDGASTVASIDGWRNLSISLTASIRLKYLDILDSCGPASFSTTENRYFRFDNMSSINSYSDYPAVFALRLGKSQGTGAFYASSYGSGGLALIGGNNMGTDKNQSTNTFGFLGDVKLGGAWKMNAIVPRSATSQVRNSSLTVLPGASVTAMHQADEQNVAGAYIVCEDAALSTSGTALDFTAGENVHYVDGTWTVNCPFGAETVQTFRGTGTLALAGGVQAGAGGVNLAGSITLRPADWAEALPLSVRDSVTIAPTAPWTFASGSALALDDQATLTLDASAGAVTLGSPIVGKGDVTVVGGDLVIGCVGTTVGSLSIADGKIAFADGFLGVGGARKVAFLRTLNPLQDVTFPDDVAVSAAKDEDGFTVYSAWKRGGMMLILR